MYPRPFLELSGWMPRAFSAGAVTFAMCSETSTITWGGASYGELGYGPAGKKSSANPDKVLALEGMKVLSVACGAGHTLFLADAGSAGLAKLPAWSPPADAAPPPAEEAETKGGKAKKAKKG